MLLAAVFVLAAAGLSTLLSTWTYLIGKGLLLRAGEMDLGRDDLPTDTVGQVAVSFFVSIGIWVALLALMVGVAVAVADWLYRADRAGLRVAIRRTCALTIWFVVWAVGVLMVNGVHHGEIRHPAGAVRAYAQLNQHWFRGGSSARDPVLSNENRWWRAGACFRWWWRSRSSGAWRCRCRTDAAGSAGPR